MTTTATDRRSIMKASQMKFTPEKPFSALRSALEGSPITFRTITPEGYAPTYRDLIAFYKAGEYVASVVGYVNALIFAQGVKCMK